MEEIKKILMQLMEGQEAIKIDISGLKGDIIGLKEGQESMKVEIINNTEIINQLAEKVDIVSNQISEFEAKTATYHLETLDEFNTVNENIAYLTHRESQTEKEVFSLKNKFQIIK